MVREVPEARPHRTDLVSQPLQGRPVMHTALNIRMKQIPILRDYFRFLKIFHVEHIKHCCYTETVLEMPVAFVILQSGISLISLVMVRYESNAFIVFLSDISFIG